MPLEGGFNAEEAKQFLEICYQVQDTRAKKKDAPRTPDPYFPEEFPKVPQPSDWKKYYAPESSFPPGDNYFEIWQSTEKSYRFVVCFRGTVNTIGSILEDAVLTMIPAEVKFKLGGKEHCIRLANDPRARVHTGFTLGLGSMLPDLLLQLELILGLSPEPELFITGHSQGAALATLCTSFLNYQKLYTLRPVSLKTYVFAQPKPGNDYYGYDFEYLTANNSVVNSRGFRVTNNQDWVAQGPLTIQLPSDLSIPNILTATGIYSKYPLLQKVIEALEKIELPSTLNYFGCGTPILLKGDPGCNPKNADDFMWQHYLRQYYKLLIEQFPV